jgi:paraquat-inducible protein A
VLYLPANFLPVMSLEILGSTAHNTMFKGVVQLWQQGYLWMATLVFLCSMALPLIELTVLFLLSLGAVTRRFHPWHRGLLRRVHVLREWGMLEVYMLGILVALIKLSDLGDTHVDVALFCFSGLLVCSFGAAMSFDPHGCWRLLDHARRRPQG